MVARQRVNGSGKRPHEAGVLAEVDCPVERRLVRTRLDRASDHAVGGAMGVQHSPTPAIGHDAVIFEQRHDPCASPCDTEAASLRDRRVRSIKPLTAGNAARSDAIPGPSPRQSPTTSISISLSASVGLVRASRHRCAGDDRLSETTTTDSLGVLVDDRSAILVACPLRRASPRPPAGRFAGAPNAPLRGREARRARRARHAALQQRV